MSCFGYFLWRIVRETECMLLRWELSGCVQKATFMSEVGEGRRELIL